MKTILDGAAIVVQLVAGVLAGAFLFPLIPGDAHHINVVGALVAAAVLGAVSYLAARYRRTLHA